MISKSALSSFLKQMRSSGNWSGKSQFQLFTLFGSVGVACGLAFVQLLQNKHVFEKDISFLSRGVLVRAEEAEFHTTDHRRIIFEGEGTDNQTHSARKVELLRYLEEQLANQQPTVVALSEKEQLLEFWKQQQQRTEQLRQRRQQLETSAEKQQQQYLLLLTETLPAAEKLQLALQQHSLRRQNRYQRKLAELEKVPQGLQTLASTRAELVLLHQREIARLSRQQQRDEKYSALVEEALTPLHSKEQRHLLRRGTFLQRVEKEVKDGNNLWSATERALQFAQLQDTFLILLLSVLLQVEKGKEAAEQLASETTLLVESLKKLRSVGVLLQQLNEGDHKNFLRLLEDFVTILLAQYDPNLDPAARLVEEKDLLRHWHGEVRGRFKTAIFSLRNLLNNMHPSSSDTPDTSTELTVSTDKQQFDVQKLLKRTVQNSVDYVKNLPLLHTTFSKSMAPVLAAVVGTPKFSEPILSDEVLDKTALRWPVVEEARQNFAKAEHFLENKDLNEALKYLKSLPLEDSGKNKKERIWLAQLETHVRYQTAINFLLSEALSSLIV